MKLGWKLMPSPQQTNTRPQLSPARVWTDVPKWMLGGAVNSGVHSAIPRGPELGNGSLPAEAERSRAPRSRGLIVALSG